jgi:hypothetical protein
MSDTSPKGENQFIFIDELWPLVIAVHPVHGLLPEAHAQMDRYYRALWSRQERYALVTLPHPAGSFASARDRKVMLEWVTDPFVAEQIRSWCVASSTVTANPLYRGTLTALLWFWSPPVPVRVCASNEEAVSRMVSALLDEARELADTPEHLVRRALQLFARATESEPDVAPGRQGAAANTEQNLGPR